MASERPTAESLPQERWPPARVMAWLRDRLHGCPWDVDQTFAPSRHTPSRKPTRWPTPSNVTTWARSRKSWRSLAAGRLPRPMAHETGAFGFADVPQPLRQDGRPPSARVRRRQDRHAEARPCPGKPARPPNGRQTGGRGTARWCLGWGGARLPASCGRKDQKRAARVGFDWKETGLSSTRSRKNWANSKPNLRPAPSIKRG